MFDALTEVAAHRWGQGGDHRVVPRQPERGSPEAGRLLARFERMAVSPSAFLRIVRMIRRMDRPRGVLPAIHVPTWSSSVSTTA